MHMMVVLYVFGAGVVVELLLQLVPLAWKIRKPLASVALSLCSFSAGGFVMAKPSIFSISMAVACLFRAFNDIRVVEGRMHQAYLHRSTRRTALALMLLQVLIAAAWWLCNTWPPDNRYIWIAAAVLQLAAAIVLLLSTVRRLQRTAWPPRHGHYSDDRLPTLTVAIPARNETEDLRLCLESLVSSDYPKLEIIVLDDCSQTRRTPEIIRSFAHDGVRFVRGEQPSETWLPKNQAYDRLAKESSGDYILFCGVDIRFSPAALRHMLSMMLDKKKDMVSIMPALAPAERKYFAPAQAMRYFWELALPRRLLRKPPVLSSCWVIKKKVLEKAGGFSAVARSIVPEAYFARTAVANDAYSFMRSGKAPGIASVKSLQEQHDTAVRTRYPQLHRRPENVLLTSLLELLFLISPYFLALAGFWLGAGLIAIALAALAAVLLSATYVLVSSAANLGGRSLAIVALPAMAFYDLGMLYYSMWQYEFSTVEWRGRNISFPAMHTIPHLPKLD